jgi:hypothetical protein
MNYGRFSARAGVDHTYTEGLLLGTIVLSPLPASSAFVVPESPAPSAEPW